ncbi:Ubx4p [Saccharomyces eubayanus]|uniref:Ubx4p n=1 Tax=Saccharomyces eubayanus TaxID=1080349 RepID=UPI0006C20157|nr:UBX4-like protein [Saccharomyces eubayanus]KOG97408.1 UBX4-like protein [Saccharomyces eubayanus]
MATVTVKYNFQLFKCKVSSNSTLNDVLHQSLQFFQVPASSNEWTLLHLSKPVPLDLPWRLLNLPMGVNLELSKNSNFRVAKNDNHNGTPSKTIKIRFQIPGRDSTIKEVSLNEPIAPILRSVSGFTEGDFKIQVFSQIVDYKTIENDSLTLENLGIQESSSIRLLIPGSLSGNAENNISNTATPLKQALSPMTTPATVAEPPSHELHKPSVFLPSNEPLAVDQMEEEEDYELTVEQARRYQQMLSMKAGTLGGPILTKRLREQAAHGLSKKNKSVTECLLRIKFPDRSHIEIAFKPDEDMHTVYDIVSQSLLDDKINFTLNQSHPFKPLANDDQKLLEDLEFGSKTMLLFETDSTSTGPFLKPHLLKDAQKISHQATVTPSPESTDSSNTQSHSDNVPKIKKTLNKVPKWLKLSKK